MAPSDTKRSGGPADDHDAAVDSGRMMGPPDLAALVRFGPEPQARVRWVSVGKAEEPDVVGEAVIPNLRNHPDARLSRHGGPGSGARPNPRVNDPFPAETSPGSSLESFFHYRTEAGAAVART